MMLKRLVTALFFVVVAIAPSVAGDAAKARDLFNGKDFSGWESWLWVPLPASKVPGAERDAKGHYTKPLGLNNDLIGMFTVETVDGKPAIHVSGEGYGTLTTVETFSNYHLRAEFKWGEKKFGAANRPRNGGFLYHAYGNHGDVGGRWMNAHQYQIEEGNCGDYIGVGAVLADATVKAAGGKRVYDPKGDAFTFHGNVKESSRCTRADGEEAASGGWNTLEIYCVGDEVVQLINGHVAVRLEKSRKENGEPLTSGHIALQIEAAEIYFRDIRIEPATEIPAKM